MQIVINSDSALGIREQIVRQLRHLIRSGALAPGDSLPSARDLGVLLKVNRNTVAAAYGELRSQGLLDSRAGSGTWVGRGQSIRDCAPLEGIFAKAVSKALDAGFSPEEVGDHLTGLAARCASPGRGRLVLVVECNAEALEDISMALRRELGVETRHALIGGLENDPDLAREMIQGVDLVVCGFNHLDELQAVYPNPPVEIVGIMLATGLRLMHDLRGLAPGTSVGFACATKRSSKSFFRQSALDAGSSLTVAWLGLDAPNEMRAAMADCDVIYATHYAFDAARDMAGPGTRLVRVDLGVDRAGIDLVGERLARGGQTHVKDRK